MKISLKKLKEKYGENWGLTSNESVKRSTFKAPTWEEIIEFYSADPARLKRLLDTDSAFARKDA